MQKYKNKANIFNLKKKNSIIFATLLIKIIKYNIKNNGNNEKKEVVINL